MRPAPVGDWLNPGQVTKRRLKALFESSSLRAEFDNDGDLMVLTNRHAYWIFVDPEQMLITIMVMVPIVDSVRTSNDIATLLEDADIFNGLLAVCTAAVRKQDGIMLIRFTSDQNYGGGLIFSNLLARLAAFEGTVLSMHPLRAYFA